MPPGGRVYAQAEALSFTIGYMQIYDFLAHDIGSRMTQTTSPVPDSPHRLSHTQRTLPIALLRAREAVLERLRPVLAGEDVTEQQWRIMRVLQEHSHIEAKQLATLACIHPSSVTRILQTLEMKKLVKIEKSKTDGRRLTISVARKGALFISRVSPEMLRIYSEIELLIGKNDINDLLDRLEHITVKLERSR